MMLRTRFLILFFCGCSLMLTAQQPFRVMFYNVENLFDCRHDSLKEDFDFLPSSDKKWTATRYWKKMNGLTKVVAAVAEERLPDLIGLCEVENDTVLRDWSRRSALRSLGYRYVMTESPDVRGIDVALMYQPGSFKLLGCQEVPVDYSGEDIRPTRNILYVKGQVMSGDTLHVIVCHLPSRLGNRRDSKERRMVAALTVRRLMDTIAQENHSAKILMMGDFNAEMSDEIFEEKILSAQSIDSDDSNTGTSLLYEPHVVCTVSQDVKGTYRYRGIWETIDHILVGGSLRNTVTSDVRIVAMPFMCEVEKKYGGVRPYRTYQGPVYKGGYSDHFPIVADFSFGE